MMSKLYPDIYIDSIFDLDPEALKDRNIRGIITDLDNTLIPWDNRNIYPRLVCLFRKLQEMGFALHIVSNNSPEKGGRIARLLGIPACWYAVKPGRRAFCRALAKMELRPHEVAVIGDQIFTDVLGGNRMGMFTILVQPMSQKDFIWTRFMRMLEVRVLKNMERV